MSLTICVFHIIAWFFDLDDKRKGKPPDRLVNRIAALIIALFGWGYLLILTWMLG